MDGRPGQYTRPLPPMPEPLRFGLCVGHEHAEWWSSGKPSERETARRICRACAVRVMCAEWSLSLPVSDGAVYGGMASHIRIAIKRERARQQAAVG